MAINSGRLVVEPTTVRSNVLSQPVQASKYAPGGTYINVVNGAVTLVNTQARYEGQVYFQRLDGDDNFYNYTMYVVVDIGGVLTWVLADLTTKQGVYSAEPFDPMYPS
jgi:hypothetical protein